MHTAGWDFWGQLSGLHQFEGGLPGPRSSESTGREPLGAAWNGEVEAQPPRSPAGPTSGQGVLRDSEPWLPALGGRSSLFAAVSTLGARPARTEGSVFSLYSHVDRFAKGPHPKPRVAATWLRI